MLIRWIWRREDISGYYIYSNHPAADHTSPVAHANHRIANAPSLIHWSMPKRGPLSEKIRAEAKEPELISRYEMKNAPSCWRSSTTV